MFGAVPAGGARSTPRPRLVIVAAPPSIDTTPRRPTAQSSVTKDKDPGSTAVAPLSNSLSTLQPAMPETIAERVRRELRERQPDGQPRDQDEGGSPVVVWDRITLHDFDQWLEKHEDELPKWDYEPDDTGTAGRVLVHDLASTVHAVVNGQLIPRIQADAVNNDFALLSTLISTPMRTITIGRDRFQPNGALMPGNGADTIPTLVLEIAYSESANHLREKLRRYMTHPAIQVAIGVKIPYTREASNQFVVLFQRDAHQNVVEQQADFGPDAAIPPTPLAFPLWKLYHGGHVPPALAGQEQRLIHIDLAWLSNLVEPHRP